VGVNLEDPVEKRFLAETVARAFLKNRIHEFLEKLPCTYLLVFGREKIDFGLDPILIKEDTILHIQDPEKLGLPLEDLSEMIALTLICVLRFSIYRSRCVPLLLDGLEPLRRPLGGCFKEEMRREDLISQQSL
jgi:hypothetical protein